MGQTKDIRNGNLQDGGGAPVNAESFTPDFLLNARPGRRRAVGDEGAARPVGPGRSSPHLQKSRFGTIFGLSVRNLVPERQVRTVVMGVPCTWRVPFVYLSYTYDVPGVPFPLVLAVPGRRTAVVG